MQPWTDLLDNLNDASPISVPPEHCSPEHGWWVVISIWQPLSREHFEFGNQILQLKMWISASSICQKRGEHPPSFLNLTSKSFQQAVNHAKRWAVINNFQKTSENKHLRINKNLCTCEFLQLLGQVSEQIFRLFDQYQYTYGALPCTRNPVGSGIQPELTCVPTASRSLLTAL